MEELYGRDVSDVIPYVPQDGSSGLVYAAAAAGWAAECNFEDLGVEAYILPTLIIL